MLTTILLASALFVVDGDTFSLDGQTVRIANIDAPETLKAKCDAEYRLGMLAKDRLKELLGAGAIVVNPGDPRDGRRRDQFGRLLAIVSAGGNDVGEALVAEGLARRWTGHRRPWC